MACHEIAALRLGLMRIIGIDDETERQHELAELGAAASQPGPLNSLSRAENLAALRGMYQTSLAALEQRVAGIASGDPKLAYYRALIVLTRKIDLELSSQVEMITRLYQDLEEMHDLVHEIYPVE